MNVKAIYRKLLLALDADLLKRIDRERKLQGLDRTNFIRRAITKYILSLEAHRLLQK